MYSVSKYILLLDHTNYVFCKGLKIYNRNMLTRSSYRIFNPMRYTGSASPKMVIKEYFFPIFLKGFRAV